MAYTSQLTERQLKTYECIIDFIKEFGFAPTVRELCKKTGFTSTSSIAGPLKALEKLGYIRRYPTCPRAITVLK